MGRMLGAFDNADELDRPDLNKCPDCGCFFAGENCPVCGKLCPEEMRAGNRKPIKPKKHKNSPNSRVTFIEWYHRWWFIVLMMFVFPIVGIILLITSPHQRWKKITFVAVGVAYFAFSQYGIHLLTNFFSNLDQPIDTSLTKQEYIQKCEEYSPEQIYRSASSLQDRFVKTTLKVKSRVTDVYESQYATFYVCVDENGSEFELLIRDCVQSDPVNLISGDVIIVYGEVEAEYTVCSGYDSYLTAPCINVAYVAVIK